MPHKKHELFHTSPVLTVTCHDNTDEGEIENSLPLQKCFNISLVDLNFSFLLIPFKLLFTTVDIFSYNLGHMF